MRERARWISTERLMLWKVEGSLAIGEISLKTTRPLRTTLKMGKMVEESRDQEVVGGLKFEKEVECLPQMYNSSLAS